MSVDSGRILRDVLRELEARSSDRSDGIWLEHLIASCAEHVPEWNLTGCWRWADWQDRVATLGADTVDLGVDLVAVRTDGGLIAIQSKARKLNETGRGAPVSAPELDSFMVGSARDVWSERWLVSNGVIELGRNAQKKVRLAGGAPLKLVQLTDVITRSIRGSVTGSVECEHCVTPDHPEAIQTLDCMQGEAVASSVKLLREHQTANEPGIPRGEARGRLILPCGTGKTRIALRITEELTYPGDVSVVLCPSIALVEQTRREFLRNKSTRMRVLAVCSDSTVAEDRVAKGTDPTLDRGNVSTSEIAGCDVTTNPSEIAEWIRDRRRSESTISVIFGTYQSASRVSEGILLADAGDAFKVLVCDEAHRTANIQRKITAKGAAERSREFALCHDRDAFPADYRVYQTATPRIYAHTKKQIDRSKFRVRSMDDQAVFGVDLYRRSYKEAVQNGWLSDYRIIAMAVGEPEATHVANQLVADADADAKALAEADAAARKGKPVKASKKHLKLPTTGDYLKGMAFALAMGGNVEDKHGNQIQIRSCIGFLNTIARSQTMANVLQSTPVREWINHRFGRSCADYRLEHLDATSSIKQRIPAIQRLGSATPQNPEAILNVGIFGEGTDSPSLSAVAFLEPRRSPIDVVQAVGRVMRRAPGKALGYIIVPVVIPQGVPAERHLATSDQTEGWQELGGVLEALRAHDERIEDKLGEMLSISLPAEDKEIPPVTTMLAVGHPYSSRLDYAIHKGTLDEAEETVWAAQQLSKPLHEFENTERPNPQTWKKPEDDPTRIITRTQKPDGTTETREDTVKRHQSGTNKGRTNYKACQKRARKMANGMRGRQLPNVPPRERRAVRERKKQERQAEREAYVQGQLTELTDQIGTDIRMNLLEKSGLTGNKIERDLNLLEYAVGEAAHYLRSELGMAAALDNHFGYDRLAKPKQGKIRADGCTVAALLWMNAAMLHQRIQAGSWLVDRSIRPLAEIKSSTNPIRGFDRSWNGIARADFRPVIDPAIHTLETAEETRRTGGLIRALRHIAREAENIAATYADMGTDHAGALFNKVMGDQASDGAFFTKPVAADLAARLALDALDPDNQLDWRDPDTWRDHRTVDLACGSGTLLAATMTEMKRRAAAQGADRRQLAELQKVAVEEVMVGLDINPVSLQLAASQLMAGNTDIKYRKMQLYEMPYGDTEYGAAAGSLELFARKELVNAGRLLDDTPEPKRVEVYDA